MVHVENALYYPHFYDISLAHTIASETRKEKNKGKLARRTTLGMLWRFAKGLTVTVYDKGSLASSASITYRGKGQDGRVREEVGTVIVFKGFKGNGYGSDAVEGIVQKRRGKADGWFAMVNIDNTGGLYAFGRMRGSREIDTKEIAQTIPKGAYKEKVSGALRHAFTVFNVGYVGLKI